MTDTAAVEAPPSGGLDLTGARAVGGPVAVAWREGTLTRAKELEALCAWVAARSPDAGAGVLAQGAIPRHLEAARQAARGDRLEPRRRLRLLRNGPLIERAMSNLDAAEAQLLNVAPADYVLGQLPSLLRSAQCHLVRSDPRRQELERIARGSSARNGDLAAKRKVVDEERGKIVTAVRAASSAAPREQLRVRSFRNVLVATAVAMFALAAVLALVGWFSPTLIPLCFAPEESGQATVVCPTAQSDRFSTTQPSVAMRRTTQGRDIDDYVRETASPRDLLIVELVGLTAAAVAAAAAVRGLRGSSERYGLPVVLAALKLPTGAVTAFLGLLLMRGQFVPGLSALDTSAQILAWALVFGYAQQLFTRLVDQQGQTVLESVRGADKLEPEPTPP
ncbi:MAG TPA: hypothetical protein VFC13_03200 [Actinomycetes bacterium]|nr:hypothetical protein [Actinomycetes bacterium]